MRGRPRDPAVDEALSRATVELLGERGFARMSMDTVASRAGVGKPAIYRRFRDKGELVAAAVSSLLPVMEPRDLGDTEAELRALVDQGFPPDAARYLGLIGGLASEHVHHPELIAAFRDRVLLPRRAVGITVIERGRARGDLRDDIPAEHMLDLFAGPFLARAFAGLDVGPKWRKRAFATWLSLMRSPERTP
jgi:AcrR family transcriptional regulator